MLLDLASRWAYSLAFREFIVLRHLKGNLSRLLRQRGYGDARQRLDAHTEYAPCLRGWHVKLPEMSLQYAWQYELAHAWQLRCGAQMSYIILQFCVIFRKQATRVGMSAGSHHARGRECTCG